MTEVGITRPTTVQPISFQIVGAASSRYKATLVHPNVMPFKIKGSIPRKAPKGQPVPPGAFLRSAVCNK